MTFDSTSVLPKERDPFFFRDRCWTDRESETVESTKFFLVRTRRLKEARTERGCRGWRAESRDTIRTVNLGLSQANFAAVETGRNHVFNYLGLSFCSSALPSHPRATLHSDLSRIQFRLLHSAEESKLESVRVELPFMPPIIRK